MIFGLSDELIFPDAELAEDDGLLAVGGDLSVARLRLAYSMGIFPWYSEGEPIMWYSPHQRFVIFADEIKISNSMRQLMHQNKYTVRYNTDFEQIIAACRSQKRRGQDGTWITDEMYAAYVALYRAGLAKCVGVYADNNLVGGLYGVVNGAVFSGESMFSVLPNTSKLALIHLCLHSGYPLIDCQVYTPHLASMGARFISRAVYNSWLQKSVKNPKV